MPSLSVCGRHAGFRPGISTSLSGRRLPAVNKVCLAGFDRVSVPFPPDNDCQMVLWHGRGTASSNYLSEDICAVVTLHTSASCVTTVGMITDR